MKRLIILTCGVLFALSSCVKPGGKQTTATANVNFVLLNKNGVNLIHSVNDNVTVSYSLNGVNFSKKLLIYRCQTSVTDTTPVSDYGGYMVSDLDTTTKQGYMTTPSSGGVRTFNLSVNGVNAGTAYFDYWGTLSTSLPQPPPSASFVFDGAFVKNDYMTGVFYTNGYGSLASSIYGNSNTFLIDILQQQ